MPALDGDKPLIAQYILSQYELESIGCMAFQASSLEEFIDDFILGLMRGEQRIVDLIVPESATLGVKANILRSLIFARTDNSEVLADYQLLHDKLMTDISRRNIVIHGVWRGDDVGENGPYRVKSSSAAVKKRRPDVKVNAGEIMLIAKALSDRAADLFVFFQRHEAFLA